MRIARLIAALTAAGLALFAPGEAAKAHLLVQIDKTAQRMVVSADGRQLYVWPVSTGGRGYDTPSGTFRPFRMDIDHRSVEWDDAPMPYSIFFTRHGDAVHGTYEARHLGRAVSHGCVRLSVAHAATLWRLVKREKMANTTIMVSGAVHNARPPPPIAQAGPRPPMPLTGQAPRAGEYRPRYRAPPFPFMFHR
jgi:L,D-transpeptidase catalytic domain